MKKEYQVTYGYKAVLSVNVKAENQEEAAKLATARIIKMRTKISSEVNLEDDAYNPDGDGILDMTETWGAL